MTLTAADISSHNAISSWPTFLGSIDILICKVSEGVGYSWAGRTGALAQARSAGKGIGVYHFAKQGDPVAEADYFLSQYTHKPGEVIILDWEPSNYTGDHDAWCATWCSRVLAATGVAPMVYTYPGPLKASTYAKTRALGCGLWIASYGPNNGVVPSTQPPTGPWGAYAMWQYTSNGSKPGCSFPLDLSLFSGAVDQWRAYGNPGSTPVALTPDDINAIALAVWGFHTSGGTTQAQDRLTGIDAAQLPAIKAELDAVKAELDAVKAALAAGGGAMPAACAMQGAVLAPKPA